MKNANVVRSVLIALIVTAMVAHAMQITVNAGEAAIAGVWRAQMRGLPAITLNITYETGSLNGAILFYLLRKEPGKAETASPGIPEPLIDPNFDGKTLTFAVSHKRAHPPESLSTPPVTFTMRITGANKAELIRGNDTPPGIEIDREQD